MIRRLCFIADDHVPGESTSNSDPGQRIRNHGTAWRAVMCRTQALLRQRRTRDIARQNMSRNTISCAQAVVHRWDTIAREHQHGPAQTRASLAKGVTAKGLC